MKKPKPLTKSRILTILSRELGNIHPKETERVLRASFKIIALTPAKDVRKKLDGP